MGTIFFTGFPGFLGVELLPRVLQRSPDERAVCLVQTKFAGLARRRVEEIYARHPALTGRIDLVEGDITAPGLGLDDPAALAAGTTELWHLAAVYDLAVRREVGMRINVDGTRNILDFAEQAGHLARFQYVSTCYVSGRHAGPFSEDDLDVGQEFGNFYEETKFLAEAEVAERRQGGLPTTIYRPAIVVGDSNTGATQKYDGPYFALQWLLRQRRIAVMPVVGDPTVARFNMVPRNFVVDAIAHLSHDDRAKDKVYQLADPRPLTVDELYQAMASATGQRLIRIPVTRRLARWSLEKIGPARQLLRIPPQAIDYMTHPTHYLTSNQVDLEGSGIACPPVSSYLAVLVEHMRRHPEVSTSAMV